MTYTDPLLEYPITAEPAFFIHNPPNWGAVIMLAHHCHDKMPFSEVVIHGIVKLAGVTFLGSILEIGKHRLRLSAFGDN